MTRYQCHIGNSGYVIVWDSWMVDIIWESEEAANDKVLGFDWIWFPVGWRY